MEKIKAEKVFSDKSKKLDRIIEQEQKLEKEPEFESLDFQTLYFLKEHVDIPELGLNPEWELEEIKRIISEAPRGSIRLQRKILMTEFKKKLLIFRENLSKAQREFENLLRNEQNKQKTLSGELDEILDRNNMQSQLHDFRKALYYFLHHRKNIRNLVENYKSKHGENWEIKLFRDLFGKEPDGGIEVDVLPVALYFYIHDLKDFMYIIFTDTEWENDQSYQEKMARTYGGVKLDRDFPKFPFLKDKVLIENSSLLRSLGGKYRESIKTKTHEEEHAIHNLLYPRSVFIKGERSFCRIFDLTDEVNFDQFENDLNKYAHFFVLEFEMYAKGEILAYLKTGDQIYDIRDKILEDEGSYNYLENWGNDAVFVNNVVGHFNKKKLKVKKKDGTYLDENELRILALAKIKNAWNGQYKNDVSKGLDAAEKLLRWYSDNHGNRMKVLRILSQEPLNKWPRIARILS